MNELERIIIVLSMYKNCVFGDKAEKVTMEEVIDLLKAQEPCEDAVSKQAVISALEGEYSDWNDDYNIPITHCIKAVQSIPPVQAMPLARVLTLEEVNKLEQNEIVWLEDKGIEEIIPAIVVSHANLYAQQAVCLMIVENPRLWVATFDYGERWRCWTSKPSLKQMEETPWK